MKRWMILLASLMFCIVAVGQTSSPVEQVVERDSILISTSSSTTVSHIEKGQAFGLSHTIEMVWTGAPTSPSITVKGCMRGNTCTTLTSSASTTNAVMFTYGVYDRLDITTSWSGAATALRLNITGSYQPGGASANNGVMALVGGNANVDGSGNYPAPLFDGSGVSRSLQVIPFVYNGATYDRPMVCPNTVAINTAASGTVELVPLSGTTRIFVCSFSIQSAAATNVKFQYGTGTTCGTGTTDLTGPYVFTATPSSVNLGSGYGYIFKTQANGQALCLNNSAAVQVSGFISYARY